MENLNQKLADNRPKPCGFAGYCKERSCVQQGTAHNSPTVCVKLSEKKKRHISPEDPSASKGKGRVVARERFSSKAALARIHGLLSSLRGSLEGDAAYVARQEDSQVRLTEEVEEIMTDIFSKEMLNDGCAETFYNQRLRRELLRGIQELGMSLVSIARFEAGVELSTQANGERELIQKFIEYFLVFRGLADFRNSRAIASSGLRLYNITRVAMEMQREEDN